MIVHRERALKVQQLKKSIDSGSTLAKGKAWYWGLALQRRARRGDARAWLDIPYIASVLQLELLLEEPCFAENEEPLLRAALVEGMRHPEAELFRSRHLAKPLDADWKTRLQPPPPPKAPPDSRRQLISRLLQEHLQGKPVLHHLARMDALDQAETVVRFLRWAKPYALPEALRSGPTCSEIDQAMLNSLQVEAVFHNGKLVSCTGPGGYAMKLNHEKRSGSLEDGYQDWVYRSGRLESFSIYDDTSQPRPFSWEHFIALGILTCAGLDVGL